MSKKYVVIKQHYNWADEIDFDAHLVCSESDWKRKLKVAKDYDYSLMGDYDSGICIGTNEYVQFSNFQDFKASVTKTATITEDEFTVLKKQFGIPAKSESFVLGDFLDPEDRFPSKDEDEDEDRF
jgi:hypothetical protein